MRGKMALLFALCFFANIGLVSATGVDSCIVIDQPGYYLLTRDVLNSTDSICIYITSSDVVFDGNGHVIDGIDAANTYGIYVGSQSYAVPLTNVTIMNVVVTGWGTGVYVSNSKVANISVFDNVYRGVALGINNTIENCSVHDNQYSGIDISGYNNTVRNCNIYKNDHGVDLAYLSESNRIENNNISWNGYGIFFGGENAYNSISENILIGNDWYGIRLSGEGNHHNNVISNNTIKDVNIGIRIEGSSYSNVIVGNIVVDNRTNPSVSWGVSIINSTGNVIYNNFIKYRDPVTLYNSTNVWNVTLTAGTNVVGGNYIGGNAWLKPDGTGFSQTCSDSNNDGICDRPYYLDSSNVDYLPLKYGGNLSSPSYVVDLALLRYSKSDRFSTDNDTVDPTRLLTYTVHGINLENEWDGYGKAIDGLTIFARTTKPITDVWDNNAVWSGNEANWDLSDTPISDGDRYYTGILTDPDNATVEMYVSRSINKTVFSTSGYQEVNITFRFYNTSWNICEIRISGYETDLVKPEALGTFETNFPKEYGYVNNGRLFVGAPCNQIENKTYYLKGYVKVGLKQNGINVVYKPEIWASYITPQPEIRTVTSSLRYSNEEIQITINTSSEFNWTVLPYVLKTVELHQISLNQGFVSKGDFNYDGIVDIADVTMVAYMVSGKVKPDLAADFNGNGRVDIGDLAKIAYYMLGKISEL